ncbi:MAG: D-cysteine desulfhydrase family protein [Firmicutes bacterium]|nr:D-cysteine desulfhydrase family protein [Bacillota bacterium]
MTYTTKEARELLGKLPKTALGFFPTPLYKLDKLSAELGIELYIKRDDFTGSNLFGGNKTRKLEYLIGKAKAEGCDHIFTYGAVQSNHAMQTVWAAAKNGIKPVIYLAAIVPIDENDIKANLLLDRIYDAEIHIVEPLEGESFMDTEERSFKMGEEHIKRLEAEGHKCMNIPVGGADETGSLGYIGGITELYEQADALGVEFDYLYHATGSGGTMAGMMAGRNLLGRNTVIRSISAMEIGRSYAKHAASLSNGALALMGIGSPDDPLVKAEDFAPDDNYYAPGYEIPNEATTKAIKLLAKTEGILVDPVYSGKAFSALLDHVKTGKIEQGSKVVFVHTGGATVFFAEKEILGDVF